MYSPTLAEWGQPEPNGAAYVEGPDLYEAFEDDPIDRMDPTGMSSRSFGDGSPIGSAMGPTLPVFPGAFTHPAPQSVEFQVAMHNDVTGTLKITWDKVPVLGPAGIAYPGVKMTFTFTPDKGVVGCGDLSWYQEIRSTIDNSKSYKPSDFTKAIAHETSEHGGHDPFGSAFVGDNASGDSAKPYGEGYAEKLQGNNDPYSHTVWMKDAPMLLAFYWPPGAVVTKNFFTALWNGKDDSLGLTIEWHTTQTAGDASKTLVSGMVTWDGN